MITAASLPAMSAKWNPIVMNTTIQQTNAPGGMTKISIAAGFKIGNIELQINAEVPNLDERTFQAQAEAPKKNCPVPQALAGVEILLQARLIDQPSRQ